MIQRENIGFDFGAYSFYVENNWEIIKQKYTHFIFINASVRGPYGCEKHNWQNDFISMINDRVKLVGNSINILTFYNKQIDGFDFPYPHVQSYMFVMDLECLQFLHDKNIFQNISVNKDDVILQKEILMSLLVLKNGWDINCTLEKYKNIDYKTLKSDINPTSFWGIQVIKINILEKRILFLMEPGFLKQILCDNYFLLKDVNHPNLFSNV